MWANEFEMGVICDALDMVCLIIDFQARDTQSRFVSVGKKENGKEKTHKHQKETWVCAMHFCLAREVL